MARGWTQAELANRIGCSPATISQLEVGRKKFSAGLREKIRKAGLILAGGSDNGNDRVKPKTPDDVPF